MAAKRAARKRYSFSKLGKQASPCILSEYTGACLPSSLYYEMNGNKKQHLLKGKSKGGVRWKRHSATVSPFIDTISRVPSVHHAPC